MIYNFKWRIFPDCANFFSNKICIATFGKHVIKSIGNNLKTISFPISNTYCNKVFSFTERFTKDRIFFRLLIFRISEKNIKTNNLWLICIYFFN